MGKNAGDVCGKNFCKLHQCPKPGPFEGLVREIFDMANKKVFGGLLPDDMPVVFKNTLVRCAGRFHYSLYKGGVRKGWIALNPKLLTTEDRLRTTLLHEMCHAGTFFVDEVYGKDQKGGPHGELFWKWAKSMNNCFSVEITQYHDYIDDTTAKYEQKCLICRYTFLYMRKPSRDICKHCTRELRSIR